jgi:hypothetical protein
MLSNLFSSSFFLILWSLCWLNSSRLMPCSASAFFAAFFAFLDSRSRARRSAFPASNSAIRRAFLIADLLNGAALDEDEDETAAEAREARAAVGRGGGISDEGAVTVEVEATVCSGS